MKETQQELFISWADSPFNLFKLREAKRHKTEMMKLNLDLTEVLKYTFFTAANLTCHSRQSFGLTTRWRHLSSVLS